MKHLATAFWLVCYLALMGLGMWELHRAHQWALASFDSTSEEGKERQADWEKWRKEAEEQADGKGPVKRRIPKSTEPPTLVLLRDYYGMCLTAFLLFGSVLYGTFVFFVRGIFSSPGRFPAGP